MPPSERARGLSEALLWWSSATPQRFPSNSTGNRTPAELGTDNSLFNQHVEGAVPTVPAVPVDFNSTGQRASGEIDWGQWQERAAIREYDGCMRRAEAEALTQFDYGPCPNMPSAEP